MEGKGGRDPPPSREKGTTKDLLNNNKEDAYPNFSEEGEEKRTCRQQVYRKKTRNSPFTLPEKWRWKRKIP